jgi:hypothetical protein
MSMEALSVRTLLVSSPEEYWPMDIVANLGKFPLERPEDY